MTPGAAFFGQLLPLTHYLAVQGECWILNSPLDHVFTRLAPLALLIVVPMAAGLPILGVRLRAWSSKDPEKDRIRTLLVKESLITDETQGQTFHAAPFPAFIEGIIESGGLLNSLKARGVAK